MNEKVSSIIKKIKQMRVTVASAPPPIRRMIEANLRICAVLVCVAILALLLSLIPALSSARGVAIICTVIAVYLMPALPGYMRTCRNYIEICGIVKSVKRSTLKSLKAARNCRVVKLTDFECRECKEHEKFRDRGPETDIQIPDTCFIRVDEGKPYSFYYNADYKSQDDRFSIAGFIACVQQDPLTENQNNTKE